jgi:predicted  nucleic acid-binding Zn-ribbon protein
VTTFDALLDVQEHDTAVDRLHHRRAHLPERDELTGVERDIAAVRAQLAEVQGLRDRVLERQASLESEIAAAGERIKEIEGRLYSGQVSATRDILAMQGEVDSLKARRSSLEDDLLAAMEEDEPLAARVAAFEAEEAGLQAAAARLREVIAGAEREIDGEIAVELEARATDASGVPESLIATYERLRTKLGGVGAARLVGPSCTGCHLTLPVQEVARIKREPPDALILCDQCGRILVR